MRDGQDILKALGRGSAGPAGAGSADGDGPAGAARTAIAAARELAVRPSELVEVLASLKGLGDFVLIDIDAVDRPEGFDVAYRLLDRGGEGPAGIFTVKARADRSDPRLPSVMSIWKAADVMEREVWDLMGVVFEGRTGLKRILCKDDFEGHPLRKDYILVRTPRFPVREELRPAEGAEGGQR